MDDTPDLDIGCQEITVKYKRIKKRKIRSKKFKKILDILQSGKERHIIQYTNEEKTEFEVKYVDKKNKKVWSERDISLFLALDAVSPKPRDQKNLAEETKNRFKSNMLKFVRAGYLKYLGLRKVLKTVVYKKYRILKDFPIGDDTEEGCSQQSTGTQSRGSSEDRSHSMGSSSNSSCSFPSTFHYSCLSEKSLESDEYEMRADGNEESINNLPVANEVAAKDYIASETSNLSIGTQYVNRPNWNSEIISYGNERSINIVPEVGEEIEVKDCIADEALNFPIGMKYVNEPNSEEYENIPNENEESVNILHEVNEEMAAEDYIAGETSNLSIEMQYVNKPNWNSEEYQIIPNGREDSVNILQEANSDEYENIPYKNEESVNILFVMNLVAKGYISDEALIGVQYVNKPNWNSEEYENIPNENEESVNILLEVNEKIAAKDYKVGEASNLSIGTQYVNTPNWNSNEYEIIPDGNEKSSNNLPVMNEEGAAKDYIAHETSNLSIGMQYVNKPNWNSEEYENIPNENEESVNILHEVNEEISAKDYKVGEASNLSIGMQYVNKPNWNSNEYEIIPDGIEKSRNNLPVMNEEGAAKDYIALETSNLSIGMQYVNKPNWNSDEYESITYRNEDSVNILPVVNEAVEKDSVADEALFEQKRKLNYSDTQSKKFRESDWSPTKSNFDDATLFEEMEHDEEILKDSTNPLLSSAVVSEQNTGLISDSIWQTEYKMFSFDENMYDSS